MDTPAIQRGIIVVLWSALAKDYRKVDAWDIELMPMRIVDLGRAGRHHSPSRLGLVGNKDIHASALWKWSLVEKVLTERLLARAKNYTVKPRWLQFPTTRRSMPKNTGCKVRIGLNHLAQSWLDVVHRSLGKLRQNSLYISAE